MEEEIFLLYLNSEINVKKTLLFINEV